MKQATSQERGGLREERQRGNETVFSTGSLGEGLGKRSDSRRQEARERQKPHAQMRAAASLRDTQPGPKQEKDSLFFLERLEEKIKAAKKLPLSEQCIVDRMELLILLDNAKKSLPDDLRRAQWLLEQNHNLIAETRKEAEKIMREAEQEIAKMVDEHEITQAAQEEARNLLEEAGMQSRQIHEEAMQYASNLLQELEDQLTEILVYVRKNKSQM